MKMGLTQRTGSIGEKMAWTRRITRVASCCGIKVLRVGLPGFNLGEPARDQQGIWLSCLMGAGDSVQVC